MNQSLRTGGSPSIYDIKYWYKHRQRSTKKHMIIIIITIIIIDIYNTPKGKGTVSEKQNC